MANFNISYKFVAIDKFSRISKKIGRNLGRVGRAAKAAAASMISFGGAMAALATAGAGAAMWNMAKAASQLADGMRDVSRVTSSSGPEIDALKKKFRDMAKETGVSAVNLASVAYEGGKMGVAGKDMEGFVRTVVKVGLGFDMAQSTAANSLGKIKDVMKLTFSETEELMQRTNYLADNITGVTGESMVEILLRTAGVAKSLKLPPDVAAGWAAFANRMEITPQLAASGINMMTQRMMAVPGMMEKILDDPRMAMEDYLSRIAALEPLKREKYIVKTFGVESARFVRKAVTSMDQLRDSMEKAMSKKALGSLDREYSKIMDSASQKALQLRESARDAAITLGDKLLEVFIKLHPYLMKITEDFGNWLDKITPGDIEKISTSIQEMGEGLLVVANNLERISKVADTVKALSPVGAATEYSGMAMEFLGKAKSQVEVFIKGDTKNVEKVRSKGGVSTKLNTGQSMVPAT